MEFVYEVWDLKFVCRWEESRLTQQEESVLTQEDDSGLTQEEESGLIQDKESGMTQQDERFPVLLPTAETSDAADKEVNSPEKEEELGICQVLERLEEVTNMLTTR